MRAYTGSYLAAARGRVLGLLLLAAGAWQFGGGIYIYTNAGTAQHLPKADSEQTRIDRSATKPWPWADTAPLARLTLPAYGVDLLVLEGSSGRSLAFGPGHITGTALPGERGNSVISAHRDTHFTFLRDVRYGDELSIENARREVRRYRVTGIAITDKSNLAVLRGTGAARLTLVTCYPFNAISAVGPLRYVVTAERLEGAGAI